jgi:asparagine N-glycosylation enzyme membrane subunit Stt3
MPPSHDDDEPLHEKLLRRRILVFFAAAVAKFLLSFAYSGDASFSAPFNIFFFVLLLLTRHGGAQSLSGQVKFLCLPMLCYAATNALLHNLSLLWSWVKGTHIVFRVVIVPSAMINVATFFGYLTGTWPPRGLHQRLGWLRFFAAISSVGESMLRLQVAVTALIYGIKTLRRSQDNQTIVAVCWPL